MPQTAIGTHFDVALDVQRHFLAEIAFDGAFFFQNLTDVVDFFFRQIADLLVRIDAGAVHRLFARVRPIP